MLCFPITAPLFNYRGKIPFRKDQLVFGNGGAQGGFSEHWQATGYPACCRYTRTAVASIQSVLCSKQCACLFFFGIGVLEQTGSPACPVTPQMNTAPSSSQTCGRVQQSLRFGSMSKDVRLWQEPRNKGLNLSSDRRETRSLQTQSRMCNL